MKHNNNTPHTRKEKVLAGEPRKIKSKFQEDRKAPPIVAKNEFQKDVLRAIKTKQIVVLQAPAGVGKSYLTMAQASDWLVNGDIDKLIIARTAVGMGRTHGFIKGDLEQKYTPLLMPLIEVFTDRHGMGKYETALASGNLEMVATEHMRGRNIDGVAILDESQNTTPEEMFSIITRVTENGKLFIIGDATQTDIKGVNGLSWLESFVEKHGLQEHIEILKANSDNIVRGGLCKAFVKAMEQEKAIG